MESLSFAELMKNAILYAAEDESYFYVKVKEDYDLSNAMWKVDKKTKKVSYIDYTDFIVNIEDGTKEIDPNAL